MHFVSPKEASSILGVDRATLRRWAEAQKIRFIKTGSLKRQQYRYDAQGYIDSQNGQEGAR